MSAVVDASSPPPPHRPDRGTESWQVGNARIWKESRAFDASKLPSAHRHPPMMTPRAAMPSPLFFSFFLVSPTFSYSILLPSLLCTAALLPTPVQNAGSVHIRTEIKLFFVKSLRNFLEFMRAKHGLNLQLMQLFDHVNRSIKNIRSKVATSVNFQTNIYAQTGHILLSNHTC